MGIELNPSINYVSSAVMDAQGCESDDIIEGLAVERAKQLFGADHVNVRPDSAVQANMAVYFAALEPGDTILGVNHSCGGHLTHDKPADLSGRKFNFVEYGVEEATGRINYENVFGLAFKHKPKLIAAGTSSYARKIDFFQLQEVAEEVGAKLLVDMSHIAGLVAAGIYPSPIPYADFVTTTTAETLRGPEGGMIMCKGKYAAIIDKAEFTGIYDERMQQEITAVAVALKEALSPEFKAYQEQTVKNARALAAGLSRYNFNLVTGGTDNHVILIDLRNKNLTGQEAKKILGRVGLTIAKNPIPSDTGSAGIANGILLGTSAVTSRGMKEEAMGRIAETINIVITNPQDEISLVNAGKVVADFSSRYPLCQAEFEV